MPEEGLSGQCSRRCSRRAAATSSVATARQTTLSRIEKKSSIARRRAGSVPASEFRRGPIVTRGSIGPLALGVNPGTHESCKTGYPLRKILQVEYADSVLIEHAPLLFGRDSMPGQRAGARAR